ncbi:MAG: YfcE family phosphodiesterase [Candidatus Moranbacteria bacterium]|nr:YfcE family phosphodiesterase [Candidatus Moranbacteria bacterium]
MKIAFLSDIHDHTDNLRWALEEIVTMNADQIVCLGDIVSSFTARILSESSIPVFAIFGNNEGDRGAIVRTSLAEGSNLTMATREFACWEYRGKQYFLSHYPELAENTLSKGIYEAVFHGHTHKKRYEVIEGIPLINPGEIAGIATGIVSFALFDTETKEVQFFEKEKK